MSLTFQKPKDEQRPQLTPREREVLLTWLENPSKAATAEILGVAEDTVRSHISHIRHKYAALDRPARSKAELLIRAIEDGIIKAQAE
ncbi:LuxR family transcriptional regulator [Corynebacterium sp. 13CS0277]|uniref:response regulator transcription factor n=1 Tax=Corynebacterium sp. 13CS0277 TaxID=2071994 RepID=UPI000D038460|nr:helix-turn-helix transcriptional regulator [Corynebacterium sp. 13CS0277]PRQ10984.1 LuxR family transcriptional regulator [Corynebacterium sp. 13CS0277]